MTDQSTAPTDLRRIAAEMIENLQSSGTVSGISVRRSPSLRSSARSCFAVNQLDVVLRGHATTMVWINAAVTYLVPFCVANTGVLVVSRDR